MISSSAPQPGEPTPDVVIEARGVLCPVPIIRLARAAAALPAGTVVELRTDDVAAQHDVPAWCRLRGHHLLHTGGLPPAADSRDVRLPPAVGPGAPIGPEPTVPNPEPGPAQRHLIRLAAGNAGAPGRSPGTEPST